MIISDSAFWFLAFALYVIDNIKLIDGKEMLLVEGLTLRMEPRLAQIPFEIMRRCLVVLNPFLPFLMAFKMRWLTESSGDIHSLRRDRCLILTLQKRVMWLRLIAGLSFINLFVAGPILTSRMGLASSLILIGPIHIAVILILVMFFVIQDAFGLPMRYWVTFVLECLICPMYLPTVLKRLSWRIALESGGVAFANLYSPASLLPDLQQAVEIRTAEMLEGRDAAVEKETVEKHLSQDTK